jgi:hypothetical protein
MILSILAGYKARLIIFSGLWGEKYSNLCFEASQFLCCKQFHRRMRVDFVSSDCLLAQCGRTHLRLKSMV